MSSERIGQTGVQSETGQTVGRFNQSWNREKLKKNAAYRIVPVITGNISDPG